MAYSSFSPTNNHHTRLSCTRSSRRHFTEALIRKHLLQLSTPKTTMGIIVSTNKLTLDPNARNGPLTGHFRESALNVISLLHLVKFKDGCLDMREFRLK
mmetsp:Transcript_1338/g.2427  ORF Transcript_1338/g.2427 Transcript_1338/m.2427 type:complete len:99 (-) Transcript_1338:264-560(-)